jgi:aryl-alcohol dehydrogenase-like predicted oxidoreductase
MNKLGKNGPDVSAIGLGCMGMSGMYGLTSDEESVATIQAALDKGVSLLNTGDFYGMGHNELLIGKAIKGRRDSAFIAVKFGALRGPDGNWNGLDTRPVAVKNFVAYSLKRLECETIDLYQPCRVDPTVPIEETVAAISELVKAGYVRHIGLSEVSPETLRRAHKVHPITAVEIEYSLLDRQIESDLLPVARELGVAIVAYGVLGRGLIKSGPVQIGAQDYRAYLPRFNSENFDKNRSLVEAVQKLAEEKKVSASQIAVAWVLSQGQDIFPLVGAKTREQLTDAVGALSVKLSKDDLTYLDQAFPVGIAAGTRYPEEQMASLNG